MIIYALTVCMFFIDPKMNTCIEFARAHQTIERCEQHGQYIVDKVEQSPLVTGTAWKCTEIDDTVKT